MKQLIFKIIVLALVLLSLGLQGSDEADFQPKDSNQKPLTTSVTKN